MQLFTLARLILSYKAIIFDLDGTLVNTLTDLANSMNFALKQLSQPPHTAEECKKMIGNGLIKFAERALADDKQNLRDELLVLMRGHYRNNCFVYSTLYDGISEIISTLHDRGAGLGVLTNKDHLVAVRIVEHFFGKNIFGYITGVAKGMDVKPDPQGALKIADAMGLKPSEILFAGDSDVDIQTAKNAKMGSIGVSWGFRDRAGLQAAGADIIIDKPAEILNLLA